MDKSLQSRQIKTLVDLLRLRAAEYPTQRAYTFLLDGETEALHLTYAELDQQARAVAARLQQQNVAGQPVLLLYPPGLDFIAALFGCFYAGAVAVPAYPPQLNRNRARLSAIMTDAQATILLTDTTTLPKLERWTGHIPLLETTDQCNTDTLLPKLADDWVEPKLPPDALAFLQYTSGSTGAPKGVMIGHDNLLHNLEVVRRAFQIDPNGLGVFWLPQYHDMGLIGSLLEPMYVGGPSLFMSPAAFIERPIRWLRTISTYKGTISGGPNFAYDLCVEKITPGQRQTLDLSSWQTAFCGAEPVRPETLERFAAAFASCGFWRGAFHPCYGLAEATLMVSGGINSQTPLEIDKLIDPDATNPRKFISCGQALLDQKIVIADPQSLTPCPPDEIGEIWVSGPSVAQGYWRQPEESKYAFQACLAGGEGPFLRTGDLGFLHDGELFITGRLKDLIIIRGQNYHPQDLELAAAAAHSALQPHSGAAFTVDTSGQEQLIVAFELKRRQRKADPDEVADAIRQAIAAACGLHVDTVILLKPGGLPRTSSGKIQRYLCREKFLADALPVLGRNTLSETDKLTGTQNTTEKVSPAAIAPDRAALEQALLAQIAQTLALPLESIDLHRPVSVLGIDSLKAVTLQTLLETTYGLTLSLEDFMAMSELSIAQIAAQIETGQWSEQTPAPAETVPAGTAASSDQPVANVLDKAHAFDLMDRARQMNLMPYFRELTRNDGPTCIFEGREVTMLGSNNYLGLTVDERVRQAAANASLTDGPSLTGSRLLNGSTKSHRAFEQKLADFLQREDALVFATGYQANIGLLSALMTPETTLLVDERCHASIYDGAFVGRCNIAPFQHNHMADLEQKLQQIARRSPTMVMVDGVYSMEGDLADLPAIRQLCHTYHVPLAVDDAHGLGTLGATGRGIEEHFNRQGAADILTGTFSKSLASIGGWVAAGAKVIDYIRFHGRSMIFSAAIAPPALAAASAALDVLLAESWRVQRLNENADYWRTGLKELGFNTGSSETAIVPVIIGDDLQCARMGQALLEAGVYVNTAAHPAVPRDMALLRTSVMATHRRQHLDHALETFARVGRELGII